MCYYLYPDKALTDEQIWDKIFDVLELDVYFKSDFSGLNNTEKAILCFMINKEEKDLPASEILTGAKEIMPKGIEISPTQRSLDVMTRLNILRHKNDNYYIANSFFRSWLIGDKDNLFCDIIRRTNVHETNSTERPTMLDELKKIRVDIDTILDLLKDMERRYENGLDPNQYFRMRKEPLEQKWSVIEKLNDILSEKGAGALADVVRKLPTTQDYRELRDDLKRAAKEGASAGWGGIIDKTLETESGPMDLTVIKVAIKVAWSFR
jgi:regulator of replication initiation timing